MINQFIRKCPNCSQDLEKGVIKFRGNLHWQTTELKTGDEKKESLDGKRHLLTYRGVLGGERCNNCDLVIFYQK